MVVIDETPECGRALHFAARRAARTGADLLMLSIVTPPDNFEWIGVGEAMREEAEEEARERLEKAGAEARADAGVDPQTAIRIGAKAEQIVAQIEEDEDVSFLVLAASAAKEGPGPLVTAIAGKAASTFPDPRGDRAGQPVGRGDRRAGGVTPLPSPLRGGVGGGGCGLVGGEDGRSMPGRARQALRSAL